jgi:hypothetical protein
MSGFVSFQVGKNSPTRAVSARMANKGFTGCRTWKSAEAIENKELVFPV